ncbi:DEAD/DEAH box helicase, partial [Candidatus Dependentiae bacterium]|nr:DEAD/DEAH box helicase [Candidatus Dependentiae bacterium]
MNNFFRKCFNIDKFLKLTNHCYNISNVNFSCASMFAASLSECCSESETSVFVLPEEKYVDRFFFETSDIFSGLYILPIVNTEKYSNSIIDSLIKFTSRDTLKKIIILTPQSFDIKYPDKQNIKKHIIELKKDFDYNTSDILNFLEKNGFEHVDIVREKNNYSVRGGIIDVFPEYIDKPFRLDFFGDTLSSIRNFDENSQRSINELDSAVILPRLENIECDESLETFFYDKNVVFVYEPVLCKKNYKGDYDRVINSVSSKIKFNLSLLGESDIENSIPLNVDSNIIFNANNTAAILNSAVYNKKNIVLSANYDSQINRLINILESNKFQYKKIEGFNDIDLKNKNFIFIVKSNIIEPFEILGENILILPESSFSSGRHIKNKSHLIEYESIPYHSFSELNENDFVVHIDYGIGIYRKIETIEIDGKNQDFLLIQYADDGQLFLPVEHLNKIQKYIGDSETNPALYRLGGSAWQKVKLKAKKEIGRIAAELVELYARREIKTGIKFSRDTPWQLEFEEEFSWEETRDQLKVIDEVKRDMESEKVMDRLVCGDVGYGKTEIAVRAVFKSAGSGYQSAVIVPTTILASQHYNTFKDRFSNYPFKVEVISRFKSKTEQKQILKKLETGEIDVIIGTHRLLQKDVKFKKIGLLIIDEEQRFGVKHKERIKQMKSNIDVLSMTATPIPRTLHMSLMGIRDISVITTPPKGRIPIEVIVAEDTDEVIRTAVMNEMERKGQIYCIHNRIENIKNIESRLNRIVPEARIAVIHGRLDPEQIEDAMIDFIEKKYDILLATTIIENGLDIPNVNTLI